MPLWPYRNLPNLYTYTQYYTIHRYKSQDRLYHREWPVRNSYKIDDTDDQQSSTVPCCSRSILIRSPVRLVFDIVLEIFRVGFCRNSKRLCWRLLRCCSFTQLRRFCNIGGIYPDRATDHISFQWLFIVQVKTDV